MHHPGGDEFDWDGEFEPGLTLGLAKFSLGFFPGFWGLRRFPGVRIFCLCE